MTIAINNKEYNAIKEFAIIGAARPEYRSDRADPDHWVAMYVIDEHDIDDYGDPHKYIAWYYVPEMDSEDFELDQIDYDDPHDLQDIGY